MHTAEQEEDPGNEGIVVPQQPENSIEQIIRSAWPLMNNHPAEAIALAQEALTQARQANQKKEAAKSLLCIGYCYWRMEQCETALPYLEESVKICEELNDIRGKAQALNTIGTIYFNTGKLKQALIANEKALALQDEIGDSIGRAGSLNNLGNIYTYTGDYVRALEYFFSNLLIRKETSDKYNESISLNNIGNLYLKISDFDKALEYHTKTLEVRQEIHDMVGQATSYNNIGLVYSGMNKLGKAIEFYEKALALYEESGNLQGKATTMMNIAKIYTNTGNLPYALELLTKSAGIFREIGDSVHEAIALVNVGELYFKEHASFRDVPKAVEIVLRATEYFHKHDLQVELYKSYLILAGFFEKLQKFDLAYEYLTKYHKLERKIFTKESNLKLQSLQTIMEIEQVRREAEIHKQKNEELSSLNSQLRKAYEETQILNTTLNNVNTRLLELDQEKNEFLGIAAHDLKSPLSTILLNAQIVTQYFDSLRKEDIIKNILAIEKITWRMNDIVSKLLSIHAIETGKINLTISNTDATVLLRQLCDEYSATLKAKNLAVHFTPSPVEVVQADMQSLTEVLENLLTNAIKYSPPGKNIYISTEASPTHLSIKIKDEGPGITEDDKSKLFGKFAKLSARPTAGEGSTGLGLNIAKKLTEAMNGTIHCESIAGFGATFIVKLPLQSDVINGFTLNKP